MLLNRFLPLILLIAILITACAPTDQNPPPPDQSTGDTTTVSPGADTTTVPEVTTAAPETTAAPAPAETTAPPQAKPFVIPTDAKGHFSSDTGSNLEIHIDWSVLAVTEDTVTIRAETYITCYSISVSARQGGILRIGNASQNFSTAEIYQEKDVKQIVPFASAIVDVPRNLTGITTVDVSASWPFIGTYSGVKIDRLTCEGIIMLGEPATP
ncbi:MAG: hypothetical protein IKL84_07725 [Clostridia bacterium]|nr:hypothetical protein [Clostridia bacterium]